MTELLDRVRRTVRRHDLANPDTRVVVALSGGSDSVALAHLLAALASAGELRVAGVAHFNHQLRGAADADEGFCAEVARSLNWPYRAERGDVAAEARRTRRSIETTGRTLRHAFLERACRDLAAECVALGHTRDDQAETFLLRLLRGAGARGLASMHPRTGLMIRPTIDCRRADLRDYLAARGLPFVADESNADTLVPRNRVRLDLLPLLEERFNPSVVDALADAADIAREDWRWMEEAVDRLAPVLMRTDGAGVRFDAQALNALPVALARLLMQRGMNQVSGGRPVGFSHVDEALEIGRAGGGPLDLAGQVVQRIGADVVLTGRAGRDEPANFFNYPLSIPGEVVSEMGWAVSAEVSGSMDAGAPSVHGRTAVVQADRVRPPLGVRGRRPGDRFRPLGLAGTKKLQDFFVDRKVPRSLRDQVPIVVDEADRIVWVAGHAIADEFRVTDPAQPVLVLRLKLLGGPV